jgi:hypothetical protein
MLPLREEEVYFDPISPSTPFLPNPRFSVWVMEFELQFEASVIDRRADFFKENFGFFTHRELADHLNNNGSLARLGELLMQLASFNKSEVCIQFALQQDEVLALAGIPIEMIANREQHIARCLVDVHKIDRIGLFDGHELLLLSPDNSGS